MSSTVSEEKYWRREDKVCPQVFILGSKLYEREKNIIKSKTKAVSFT